MSSKLSSLFATMSLAGTEGTVDEEPEKSQRHQLYYGWVSKARCGEAAHCEAKDIHTPCVWDRLGTLAHRSQERRAERLGKLRGSLSGKKSASTAIPASINPQHVEILKNIGGPNAPELDEIHGAVLAFRKLLSVEVSPPIDAVLEVGVLPHVLDLIEARESEPFNQTEEATRFEASWMVCNLVSGSAEQTKKVVDMGGVRPFMKILRSRLLLAKSDPNYATKMATCSQCIWTLGNIAGDGPLLRDMLLTEGLFDLLLQYLQVFTKLEAIRNTTWCLSNLCRGKPPPPFAMVKKGLVPLTMLLDHHDNNVIIDAAWALSYISDGENSRIEGVIKAGSLPKLVSLLKTKSEDFSIITPVLRTLGNIVTGDDSQTQAALNAQLLPNLAPLLRCTRKGIRKETLWTLSNITAGSRSQIQAVIDTGLIPQIVSVLRVESDFEVRKEAAWTLANLTSGGSKAQQQFLFECGGLIEIVKMLGSADARITLVCLEAIQNLLHSLRNEILDSGQLDIDALNELLNSAHPDVYEKAAAIMEMLDTNNSSALDEVQEVNGFSF